ncbi:conserved Plasmodium protein, unknown function [Plasmodium chabaudi chabaudi]|uniref:PHD-type domain-containing protein n=1 Tax=Plasmodium chabaudi chabaudi TaxID=31271 RepID=A0A1C6YLQ9_PLACU|nr:conserved Plasmodium protein, unknown function [Plasmodium chabaudi chabaudi]
MERGRPAGRRNNDLMSTWREGNSRNDSSDNHQFWSNIENQYFSNFDKRIITTFEDHIKCTDYICNKIKNKKIKKEIFQNIKCQKSSVKIKLNINDKKNEKKKNGAPNIPKYMLQNNQFFNNNPFGQENLISQHNNQFLIDPKNDIRNYKANINPLFNDKQYMANMSHINNIENMMSMNHMNNRFRDYPPMFGNEPCFIDGMPMAGNNLLLNTMPNNTNIEKNESNYPDDMNKNINLPSTNNTNETNDINQTNLNLTDSSDNKNIQLGNTNADANIVSPSIDNSNKNIDITNLNADNSNGLIQHEHSENSNAPNINDQTNVNETDNNEEQNDVNTENNADIANNNEFPKSNDNEFSENSNDNVDTFGKSENDDYAKGNEINDLQNASEQNNTTVSNCPQNEPSLSSENKNDVIENVVMTSNDDEDNGKKNDNDLSDSGSLNNKEGTTDALSNDLNNCDPCNNNTIENSSIKNEENFNTNNAMEYGMRNMNSEDVIENVNNLSNTINAKGMDSSFIPNINNDNNYFSPYKQFNNNTYPNSMNNPYDNKIKTDMNIYPMPMNNFNRDMYSPHDAQATNMYSNIYQNNKSDQIGMNNNQNDSSKQTTIRNASNSGNINSDSFKNMYPYGNNGMLKMDNISLGNPNFGINDENMLFMNKNMAIYNNGMPGDIINGPNKSLPFNDMINFKNNNFYPNGYYNFNEMVNYQNAMAFDKYGNDKYFQKLKNDKSKNKRKNATKMRKHSQMDEQEKTQTRLRSSRHDGKFFNPLLNKKYDGVGRLPYIHNTPIPNGLHISIYVPKNYDFSENNEKPSIYDDKIEQAETTNNIDKGTDNNDHSIVNPIDNTNQVCDTKKKTEQEDTYEIETLAKLLTEITLGDKKYLSNRHITMEDKERCYKCFLDELKNYNTLPIILGNILPYWNKQKNNNLVYKIKNLRANNAKPKYIPIQSVNKVLARKKIKKKKILKKKKKSKKKKKGKKNNTATNLLNESNLTEQNALKNEEVSELDKNNAEISTGQSLPTNKTENEKEGTVIENDNQKNASSSTQNKESEEKKPQKSWRSYFLMSRSDNKATDDDNASKKNDDEKNDKEAQSGEGKEEHATDENNKKIGSNDEKNNTIGVNENGTINEKKEKTINSKKSNLKKKTKNKLRHFGTYGKIGSFNFLKKYKFSTPKNSTVPFNSSIFSLQKNQHMSNVYFEFILTNINLDKYKRNILNVNYNHNNSINKKNRIHCIKLAKLRNTNTNNSTNSKSKKNINQTLQEKKENNEITTTNKNENTMNSNNYLDGTVNTTSNSCLGDSTLFTPNKIEEDKFPDSADQSNSIINTENNTENKNITNEISTLNETGEVDMLLKNNKHNKDIKNINEEICVLFSRYMHNIKQQKKMIVKLLDNIKNEKKKPYKYWYSIEDKMINFYINEYLKNKLNTKHTYTLSKQIVDLLKLRVTVNHSSQLPNSWTEKALCNICSVGEDWDDNPIVFCDCCYTPMHSFCTGFRNVKNQNLVKRNPNMSDREDTQNCDIEKEENTKYKNNNYKYSGPKNSAYNNTNGVNKNEYYQQYNKEGQITKNYFNNSDINKDGNKYAHDKNNCSGNHGKNGIDDKNKNKINLNVIKYLMEDNFIDINSPNSMFNSIVSNNNDEKNDNEKLDSEKEDNQANYATLDTQLKNNENMDIKNEHENREDEGYYKCGLNDTNNNDNLDKTDEKKESYLDTSIFIHDKEDRHDEDEESSQIKMENPIIEQNIDQPTSNPNDEKIKQETNNFSTDVAKTNTGYPPNTEEEQWICPLCSYLRNQILYIEDSIAFKIIRHLSGPQKKKDIDLLIKACNEYTNDNNNTTQESGDTANNEQNNNKNEVDDKKKKEAFSYIPPEEIIFQSTSQMYAYKYKSIMLLFDIEYDINYYKLKYQIEIKDSHDFFEKIVLKNPNIYKYKNIFNTIMVSKIDKDNNYTKFLNENIKMFRQESFYINPNFEDSDSEEAEQETKKKKRGRKPLLNKNEYSNNKPYHDKVSNKFINKKNKIRSKQGGTVNKPPYNKTNNVALDANGNVIVRKRGRPLGSTKLNKMKMLALKNKNITKSEITPDENQESTIQENQDTSITTGQNPYTPTLPNSQTNTFSSNLNELDNNNDKSNQNDNKNDDDSDASQCDNNNEEETIKMDIEIKKENQNQYISSNKNSIDFGQSANILNINNNANENNISSGLDENGTLLKYNYSKNFSFVFKIPTCCICEFGSFYQGGGPIKRTNKKNQWCHIRCASISNCIIEDKIEICNRERNKYKCSLCLRTNNIGIIKCNVADCYKYYHISCATSSNKYLIELNENNKLVLFCSNHSQKKAPTEILRKYQILREKEYAKHKLEDKINVGKMFDAYILQNYLKISDMKLFNLLSLSSLSVFKDSVNFNYDQFNQTMKNYYNNNNYNPNEEFNDLYQNFDQYLLGEGKGIFNNSGLTKTCMKKSLKENDDLNPEVKNEKDQIDISDNGTKQISINEETAEEAEREYVDKIRELDTIKEENDKAENISHEQKDEANKTEQDGDNKIGNDAENMLLALEEPTKVENAPIDIFDIENINKISTRKCNNIISISSFKNIYNENLLDEDSLLKLIMYDFLNLQKDIQEFNSNILSDKYKRLKNFETILLLYPHFNDYQLKKLSELILEKYNSNILNIKTDDSFIAFFNKFLSLLNSKNLMICSVCLSKAIYNEPRKDAKKTETDENQNSINTSNIDSTNNTTQTTLNETNQLKRKLRGSSSNINDTFENKKERRLGSLSVLKKCSQCNVFICYFCCHRMNIDMIKNYINNDIKMKSLEAAEKLKNKDVPPRPHVRTNKVGRPCKNPLKLLAAAAANAPTTSLDPNANIPTTSESAKPLESIINSKLENNENCQNQSNDLKNDSNNPNAPNNEPPKDNANCDVNENKEISNQQKEKKNGDSQGINDGTNNNLDAEKNTVVVKKNRPGRKKLDPNSKINMLKNIIPKTNEEEKEEEFICPRCEYFKIKKKIVFCSYCPRLDGFLNCFEDKVKKELLFVHPKCLEYVNTAYSKKNNVNETKAGGLKKVCSYCRIKHGIVITCSNTDCDASFHISCGILLGCKMDNFFGRVDIYNPKKAYCFKHTFQSCKKNTLANFINTNKLFYFENFLYFPFNHLYNFLLGTYIFNYLNKKCINHLLKPIKISEPPSISALFEKTQFGNIKRNTLVQFNDYRKIHKDKLGLNSEFDSSQPSANIYSNDINNSNMAQKMFKSMGYKNEINSVMSPSMNSLMNMHPDYMAANNYNLLDPMNKLKGNMLISDKRNTMNIPSEYYKNGYIMQNATNNKRSKNSHGFIDDEITRNSMAISEQNDTDEMRQFSNYGFNRRSIDNNNLMYYNKKIDGNPNMLPFFNNNMGALNQQNFYNYYGHKYDSNLDKNNILNKKGNKNNGIVRKRRKKMHQDSANPYKKINANIMSTLENNNGTEAPVQVKKRGRTKKNKNLNIDNANLDSINPYKQSYDNPKSFLKHDYIDPTKNYSKYSQYMDKDIKDFDTDLIKDEKIYKQKNENDINDGQIYCPVCKFVYEELSDGSPADGLNWIGCDKCERWYHWICCKYSIDNPPDMENDWYCSMCLNS